MQVEKQNTAPAGLIRDTTELAVVVISLCNEPGLVDAVRSLRRQHPPPEIVVVNSGGGDPGTTLAASGIEVDLIDHPRPLYPGAARNLGVRATRAPFIAFLAADCQAEPGWVAERVRRHRGGADAVASVVTNGTPGRASGSAAHLLLYARRMRSTPAGIRVHYGLSYARPLLERVGPFREDIRQGEDSELNHRLGRASRVEWAPRVQTAHRNSSGPWPLMRDQYARGRRSRLYSTSPLHTLLRVALVNRPLDGLRQARRTREERRRLLWAAPLMVPASFAYALGLIRLRLDPSWHAAVPASPRPQR